MDGCDYADQDVEGCGSVRRRFAGDWGLHFHHGEGDNTGATSTAVAEGTVTDDLHSDAGANHAGSRHDQRAQLQLHSSECRNRQPYHYGSGGKSALFTPVFSATATEGFRHPTRCLDWIR